MEAPLGPRAQIHQRSRYYYEPNYLSGRGSDFPIAKAGLSGAIGIAVA